MFLGYALIIFNLFFVFESRASTDLARAFELNNQRKMSEAVIELDKWKPSESYKLEYKKFWENTWGSDLDTVWIHYKKLKSNKQMMRLRLDLFNRIISATDSEIKNRKNFSDQDIKKEARIILKQLNGTSEGEQAETQFLKWVQKNKFYDIVCGAERKRWVTQPDIEFSEIELGLNLCPMTRSDFLSRIRRLIFAARELQAQTEITKFFNSNKDLKDWEKAYIQAVFNSNTGDPIKAFESLSAFESDLIESDFAENYFYISQRAGQVEKSEAILSKLITFYKKNNKNTNDLFFQQGLLFYQTKKYSEAYQIFNNLFLKLKPKNKKKRLNADYEQIAWLRAWNLYLNKNYEQALNAFNEMRSYTSDSSRLSYWISMTYLNQNQNLTALKLFKKSAEPIFNNETYTYYNFLSWLRYRDLKSTTKEDQADQALIKDLLLLSKGRNSIYPVPSEDVSREQIKNLYDFILSESNGDEKNVINVVNDENEVIFSDNNAGIKIKSEIDLKQHIEWAQQLIDLGQSELAKWHLYEIEKNLKFSKNAKILIQFYSDNKFYYRALSLAQRQFSSQRLSFSKDLFILKSIYPEAYRTEIFKFAEQRKIDPYIVLSIMKAETQYKSDAISPVGAVGLMQFMPYTLEKLNSLVDQKNETQDLFKPEKSVEMGSAYLKKLSIELDNQDPLVASAYNGGPHRVKSWLKKLSDIPYDIYIEHIPFAETRTYVKRVLTFKSIYNKIYKKNQDAENFAYLLKAQPVKIVEPISLKEEWDIFKSEIQKTN